MSGNPDAQRLYNLGQALLEEKKRGPKLCTMCHSKPAEYSGFCGDCYKKLEENKKTRKVAKRKFWLFFILPSLRHVTLLTPQDSSHG